MKPNATLLVAHFYWDPGTRVEAQSYWATDAHMRVRCPALPGRISEQVWVLPSVAVKLDQDVQLDVQGEAFGPLQGP